MKFPAKAAHSVSLQVRSPRRSRFRHHPGWFAGAATLGALTLILAGCSSGSPSASSSSSSSSTAQAGQKGGTFTILANSAFGVADPAQNYTLEEWALLINTHDGLVQFKRVAGSEGTQLVPDLATEIPQPTDGGKTYIFPSVRGSSTPTAPRSSRATS